MGKYILALDQGTTSSRAILFDSEQNILAIRQHELTQHYPHEGWVEQDPMEIWSTQYAAMATGFAAMWSLFMRWRRCSLRPMS